MVRLGVAQIILLVYIHGNTGPVYRRYPGGAFLEGLAGLSGCDQLPG